MHNLFEANWGRKLEAREAEIGGGVLGKAAIPPHQLLGGLGSAKWSPVVSGSKLQKHYNMCQSYCARY